LTAVHQQFEAALPSMDSVIRHFFRNCPPRHRADALADARAALWAAWYSLIRRGKDPLEIGIAGIAARCCLFTRAGRKLGNEKRSRGCLDVFDTRAQRRLGLRILSLDRDEETVTRDGWRLWLAENNRVTPADEAAFRLDFGRWLSGLPERKRQMAELLSEGHETGVVARMLDVTPGAVSQSRTWLELSWRAFQGEAVPEDATADRRPRGRLAESTRGARTRRPEVAVQVS
jgi:hypothetical protein